MHRATALVHVAAFMFVVSASHGADTHCEHQKLVAFDAAAGANFGYAVAMDGDWLVIGAHHATVNIVNEGAVYIYQRTGSAGNAWTLNKKVFAPDNFPADVFGASVDISGDTLIVGSPGDDDNCPGMGNCNTGSAYVFQRNTGGANNWGFVKKLHASNQESNASFARSVAVSGDWAIVGQHGTPVDGGAAYLYNRNQGGANNWGFVQRVQGNDVAAGNQTGWAVDIEGDYCIFSAHKHAIGAEFDAGAAYVFHRVGNVWSQQAKLVAPDATSFDNFSYDVALQGDVALVGSPFDDDGASASGSMHFFERTGISTWSHVRKQAASDPAGDDQYGLAVGLNNNHAVAGAYFKNNGAGAAYVHDQNLGGANNWGELFKTTAFDTTNLVNFGWTVAVNGEWAAVGAYQESSAGNTAGAVYIVFLGDRDCDDNDACDDLEIAQNPSLDLDNNGILDACQCAADLTSSTGGPPDGVIDVFDLFVLLSNWNTNGPGADIAPPANVVDVFDLFALLSDWGPC